MNPWYGIIIVLAGLAGLLTGCKYLGKRFDLSPELERKGVHIGMGLICISFPLLFTSQWPVFLLGTMAILSLLAVRFRPTLRHSIGSALHGVQRASLGEIYFPLSVVILWGVCAEQPLFYSLSILVLTLADAFAALIGASYGQKQFTTKEGHKTWEGSFIFFTVTFLCIHIPMLLLTDIGRPESLLIALLIGILVMIIEAVAWRGLDNLFIPICVYIFLNIYQDFESGQIIARIGVILFAMLCLFFVRSHAKLDDASLMGASLATYIVLAIGGWQWGMAPIILFINYLWLSSGKTTSEERIHNIYALLAVTLPGFIWLIAITTKNNPAFLLFYNTAYMAELICMFIAQWASAHPSKSLMHITLKSSILGYCMIIIPFFLLRPDTISWLSVCSTFAAALFSGHCFRFIQPQIRDCPQTKGRYFLQGLVGLLASAIPWVLLSY